MEATKYTRNKSGLETRGQRIISFLADPILSKRIRKEAKATDRDESFIVRLALRKAFGLKPKGSI